MMSFRQHLFTSASVGALISASMCFGGNQELVEQKTAELCSINEQVVKQALPEGLKEGEEAEIKATVRVERSAGSGPVVRDVKVESIKIFGASSSIPDGKAPISGVGCLREPVETEKSATGLEGFRKENLNVPTVN